LTDRWFRLDDATHGPIAPNEPGQDRGIRMLSTLREAVSTNPLSAVLDAADTVILGKRAELRLALTCILAGGHLLIEDVPGVGKTTLAHLLAHLLGLHDARVQFTSNMLPAVVSHRLISGDDNPNGHAEIANFILSAVPVP
jgi:hypothetical protein